MPKTQKDFISLLQVSQKLPKDRQKSVLDQRIIALGHGVSCSRCGGSGHYSFNLVNGTTCFKCHGNGQFPPKLTDKLYAALEVRVGDGQLDAYLCELRERLAVEKSVNGAADQVMAAWTATGVSKAYSWQSAAQKVEPDRQIAQEVNRPMCEAFERVTQAVNAVSSLQFKLKKAQDKAQSNALKAEIAEAMANVLTVRDESLAAITQAEHRLKLILAQ